MGREVVGGAAGRGGDEDGGARFSYTVGLWHSFEQAEVVVFGLPEEVAHELLNAVADNVEFKSVIQVVVKQELKAESLIMFDPDHSWDERILSEQFRY